MILQRLKEYADTRMPLPPEMHGEVKIRWVIELGEEGELIGFTPLGGTGKADKNGIPHIVPTIVRAAGIKPKLLADNGEYVLGIPRDPAKAARVADAHAQFVSLVAACAEATGEPTVHAVAAFLRNWDPALDSPPDAFKPDDVLTFRVGDVLPTTLRSVQDFWARYTAGGEEGGRPVMTCLVTGDMGPVEERLPEKIKRIPNGQTSGTALVSANAVPFSSYGLKNSLTSPISRQAGERFAKALNHLIADERSHVYIGPIVYVFWTREGTEFDAWTYVQQPDPVMVKRLFDSARSGMQIHDAGAEAFYALALSASGGRAVVRDWLESTIGQAEDNLRRWFRAQRIVDVYGGEGRPLGVRALAFSAYRDASKDMTAAVPATLLRLALSWSHLPSDLLARAVQRNRAEGEVTRPRAALIKLILTKQGVVPMTDLESLDPAPDLLHDERVAYHCGRLLAELEAAQRAALGRVNATLTDRYYGSASSTPATVFPSLMQRHFTHMSKLRKTKSATYGAIDKRMQEIMAPLPTFPTTLTMQQQGLFALGYYHQRAADRAAATQAKAERGNADA